MDGVMIGAGVVVLVIVVLLLVVLWSRRGRPPEPQRTISVRSTDTRGRVAILHDELLNDPVPLGYAGKTDAEITALLNAPAQVVIRESIQAWELLEATVPAEWASLSAAEKQRYQTILSMGTINPRGANTRATLAAMFGPGTATRAAMLALQTTLGSRADVLGLGVVAVGHIAEARAYEGG